ncbi:16S rRNA (guanine(966)-N(2))-methyltransferase RsmD [Gymnodinialimonas ceratoperidinii]|uniref:16S rRNA (Guanine(966)-N(2))-methyltransferase RsmD n=1 Tax=Gymnodinialimonas ceratoperidinii TaxID=2856823 RepID=A0A8F6TX54_9RHOB|nr:16S rRNA (guanine(966)-N(2))-methyltransferase RsmD [Gymnodinialimonas ceratoperidinii]QXT39784.1 16S rRNA (guanine(966)-N(2))-methyltransferase RsmD [Gymnodinialimonas ceratoperidinii]
MRIVGGRLRGKKLAEVGAGDAAAHLRPTSDRVRESLFNLLTNGRNGDLVRDAKVLDLFAGTGALGLEALSRGASQATFVDSGAASRVLLRENIALCSAQAITKVFRTDVADLGPPRTPVDLVFLDPPYGKGLGEAALETIMAQGWLAPGATVVWEESRPPIVPAPFQLLDQRSYGGTTITILRFP